MEDCYTADRMIADALERVESGVPRTMDGLTITPLLDGEAGEAGYQTLAEAIAAGGFVVEEVSTSGEVSELRVLNKGTHPVFLLDGEEVLGAKQNRVINLSLMVPPQSATVVPVTCVERGRWSRVSDEFRPSPNSLPSTGRAAKMRDVSSSMLRGERPRANQQAVWSDIERTSERLGIDSDTDAMDAIYTQRKERFERFVAQSRPVEHQVGAIFSLHGCECGVELFDASSTWERFMPRLVRSWAVDASDDRLKEMATAVSKTNLLDAIHTGPWSATPSLGLGSDVRLSGRATTAAGLVVGGEVVHLAAFGGVCAGRRR